MKKIAIVTVDFDTSKVTHDCLASLAKIKISDIAIEIIVVDNGSKSQFIFKQANYRYPTHVLRNEENLGFTGGYNTGIAYALEQQADYVLLLNNDTYVDENFLEEMIASFHRHDNAGIIVPKIYFAKGHEFHKGKYTNDDLGKVIWYAGGFFDWLNSMAIHRGMDAVDDGQFDKEEEVFFASGCCLLIKREVFEKVGLFDNTYFLYFEDGDFSMRAHDLGYAIVYNPKAIIWHINAGSSGSGSTLHDYYLTRNRLLFGMRYAPFRTKVALLKESMHLLGYGREWQKKGVRDFYLRKFGKGSFIFI